MLSDPSAEGVCEDASDAGALWIAAKYQRPLLIVMYNNRAYYNDWNHQIVMARTRGTDPRRAHTGLQPALERAVAQVKTGKPVLVDALTQHR